jgi:L-aminopeptidase/D-esterase-like protein
VTVVLPRGFRVGHWTDREGWTGCTVLLPPPGSAAAGEVRGGGPATRETDLLGPAAAAGGVDAILLTGGSAFGLAAADGAVRYLEEQGVGFRTRAAVVPLVPAAAVYDLALGDPSARPGPEAGYAACAAASITPDRGSVGAGTGCTAGKALGPAGWTKAGLGLASRTLADGVTVATLAVVNAFGEVLGEDGSILAGAWRGGAFTRTVDLLAEGTGGRQSWAESTTLVCVVTDARLSKLEAWAAARAASGGVARAIDPAATAVDGDAAFCVASGEVAADPLAVSAVAASVTAQAIRDAVREATGAPGCPSAAERALAG